MEEYVTIPRNIKVKEAVAWNLSGKQMLYLGISTIGTIAVWNLGIPIDFKIVSGIVMMSGALFLSLGKAHGQELDSFIVNAIQYPMRRKEWSEQDEKAPVCRIHYVIA